MENKLNNMTDLNFEEAKYINGGGAREAGEAVGSYLGFALGVVSGGIFVAATLAIKKVLT